MIENLTLELPGRLSYSSLNSYAECGLRWKLERGYGLNTATWFATVAGSAIHEITEYIDLKEIGVFDGAIPSFAEVFDRRLAVEAERGIEVKPSGRKLTKVGPTGGPNKKDHAWWLEYGPGMVQNWVDWKATRGWTLAVLPEGPGVEVRIEQQIGGRDHLGFIDRVFITEDGEIVLVDLKSGQQPASTLQLGVYRVGFYRQTGLMADWGAYWMAGTGELPYIADLARYTEDYIDAQYEMAWRGIEAGVFLPNVTSMCKGCGVRDFCAAVGGEKAGSVPVRDILTVRETTPAPLDTAQPGRDSVTTPEREENNPA